MKHVPETPNPTETESLEEQKQEKAVEQPVNVGDFERKPSIRTWHLGVVGIVFGVIGIYFLLQSFAASPNKGGSGSTTTAPLSFTQTWTPRRAGQGLSTGCFGVDDAASWQGSGTLSPGASYTFTPSYPTCSTSEIPMIAMHVSWSGSTQLRLETTNPFAAALVANNAYGPYYNNIHETAPISADANGNQQANLCMWLDGNETVYAQGLQTPGTLITTNYHFPWTMTITNTGAQTANVTAASGYEANGWESNIYPGCKRADGDGDHWNDSLEMIMEGLTYAASGAADRATAYQGSNYMVASGTSAPNDEIDFSPADFNDDGVIDQTDVNTVTAQVGQGDGVSIDQIGPNQGTPGYVYNETLPWRRYDIDGDGMVTQHDVDWVKALVGQPLPLTSDPLSPWAVIHNSVLHANSNEPVNVYAVDNDMLTHVDIYATVGGKQKLLCSSWGSDSVTGIPDTSTDQYVCYVQTPRAAGSSVTLTTTAYDNAGHSYTATKTLTTQ